MTPIYLSSIFSVILHQTFCGPLFRGCFRTWSTFFSTRAHSSSQRGRILKPRRVHLIKKVSRWEIHWDALQGRLLGVQGKCSNLQCGFRDWEQFQMLFRIWDHFYVSFVTILRLYHFVCLSQCRWKMKLIIELCTEIHSRPEFCKIQFFQKNKYDS